LAGKLPPRRASAGLLYDGVGRFDFRRETRLGGQGDQRHDLFLLRSRECVPIRKSKSRLICSTSDDTRYAKELAAFNHLPFLPSLKALLVKEPSAKAAPHIICREAFNTLTAVEGTSFRVLLIYPRRIEPKVCHFSSPLNFT
jgi:hypothetical protein